MAAAAVTATAMATARVRATSMATSMEMPTAMPMAIAVAEIEAAAATEKLWQKAGGDKAEANSPYCTDTYFLARPTKVRR